MSTLYPLQNEVVLQALRHKGFGLFLEMGCGKTLISLAILWRRHKRGQVYRVLLVVPIWLIDQWKRAITRWLPDAEIVQDPLAPENGKLQFFICNYEWARERMKLLRKRPFDAMVIDEAHKINGRTSKQSRRLWLIGRTAQYRLSLTGTPIEGNELDFWAQMRFLDESIFGDSWAEFKTAYTRPAGFMGKKPVLRAHKRKEFLQRIARVSAVVTRDEMLDLPPVTDTVVPVKLAGKQLRAYTQMERDLVVQLPGLTADAPMVVTQLIRLQQIAGGYLEDRDTGTLHHLGDAKLDAATDVLRSYSKPVVVYARFLWEIDQLVERARRLRRKPSILTGKLKTWKNGQDFDILVCQIGSMAGVDGLQHTCCTAMFYSKTFSSIQVSQARDRLDRDGQKHKVTNLHFVAQSTIDADLEQALGMKGDTINNVTNTLKQRRIEWLETNLRQQKKMRSCRT